MNLIEISEQRQRVCMISCLSATVIMEENLSGVKLCCINGVLDELVE